MEWLELCASEIQKLSSTITKMNDEYIEEICQQLYMLHATWKRAYRSNQKLD